MSSATWRPFPTILACMAALGFFVSLLSHVASLFGLSGPLGAWAWLLHFGVFAVWIPAIVFALAETAGAPRRSHWAILLRNCPVWMPYLIVGLFAYAMLNFLFFDLSAPKQSHEGSMSPVDVRVFSGHWMLFYAVAFAILYSTAAGRASRRCRQGHIVGPTAPYCDLCGDAVDRP